MDQMPPVFDLTPVTRRSGEHRRIMIAGFDIRRRYFMIAVISAAPVVLASSFIGVFFGPLAAIVTIGVLETSIFTLLEYRARTGLRLPLYRVLLDRRRSTVGRWFICGMEIDPFRPTLALLGPNTVPLAPRDPRTRLDTALTGRTFTPPTAATPAKPRRRLGRPGRHYSATPSPTEGFNPDPIADLAARVATRAHNGDDHDA